MAARAQNFVCQSCGAASARWADRWLGLHVGTDIALAHAIGREIIAAGLHNRAFVEGSTTGFDDYRAAVEPWTLERAEAVESWDSCGGGEVSIGASADGAFCQREIHFRCERLGVREKRGAGAGWVTP